MTGAFDRLVTKLRHLDQQEAGVRARARIVRSAERLKASVDAQRKPDPLVIFAKAEPFFDEARCRHLLSNALAASALTPHQAVKAEALINHAAETCLAKAMPTHRPAVAIHDIIRTGNYAAIPAAPFQR